MATGAELLTINGHESDVSDVCFSPDGKQLASLEDYISGEVKLWNATTGKLQQTLDSDEVQSMSYSPDGSYIATLGSEYSLWNPATGDKAYSRNVSGSRDILQFSPDGMLFPTVDNRRNLIAIRDALSGDAVNALYGHTARIVSISFSPDGSRVATGCSDETIKLWDVANGTRDRKLNNILFPIVSPNGNCVVGGDSGSTVLRSIATGGEIWSVSGRAVFNGMGDFFRFSPDGSYIATHADDGAVKVLNAKNGAELASLGKKAAYDSQMGIRFRFNPDGSRIAVARTDGTITIWDWAAEKIELTLRCESKNKFLPYILFTSVGFSRDGNFVAIAAEGDVRLWNASTGKEHLVLKGLTMGNSSIAFSPDGIGFAVGDPLGRFGLFSIEDGQVLKKFAGHAGFYVNGVDFSADGTRIISTGSDGSVKIWDVESGEELRSLSGYSGAGLSLSFTSDGDYIAVTEATTVSLLDITPETETRRFVGAMELINDAVFSADDSKVFSEGTAPSSDGFGGYEERLVWKVSTGELLTSEHWVEQSTKRHVTADGRFLVVGSNETVVIVDQQFKNTPREKAYRELKAKPKLWWHEQKAAQAEEREDWFAAVFHRAWLLKSQPDSEPAYNILHESHDRLSQSFAGPLPLVVTETLSLPKPVVNHGDAPDFNAGEREDAKGTSNL